MLILNIVAVVIFKIKYFYILNMFSKYIYGSISATILLKARSNAIPITSVSAPLPTACSDEAISLCAALLFPIRVLSDNINVNR
mmetsp:Transcript_31766/g.36701  ORF Transcript_31766/g.36701 Transcript_31766/m.36701 type:complete len:84 (-) Transcript_31766:960-1211(-)